MLVNRVGDIGLALGICISFLTYKTVDYATIFALAPLTVDKTFSFLGFNFNVMTIIAFLLF